MNTNSVDNDIELSVVIPCYNEQEVLPEFYKRLTDILENEKISCELIFVDDGSSDETFQVLASLAENDSRVFYISFSRNFGKEAAMYAGLCNCHGKYAALMDADLQDPPEMLPEMLDKVKNGPYDCAAAMRKDRTGEPYLRSKASNAFYKIFNRISDIKIEIGARDFRVMTSDMVQAVIRMTEYNRFSKGIFSWVGFRTCWIPYTNRSRAAGKTKWNFFTLLKYAMEGIIDFSQAPLTAVSWFGLFMTILSFLALMFIIIRKILFGDPVAGWASTICVIIFIGSLQLFCLGIIGQYLARMYLEVKHRPHYIAARSNIDDLKNMR